MATDKQILRKYIKERFPVGTEIWDTTCSQPYMINKRTIFEIHPWGCRDYNPEFLPDDPNDYYVEFLVHNTGLHTRVYNLMTTTRSHINYYNDYKLSCEK